MTTLLIIVVLAGLYMVQKKSSDVTLTPIRIKKNDDQLPR
jgi:hypothetical protein